MAGGIAFGYHAVSRGRRAGASDPRGGKAGMNDPIERMLNEVVVLDTGTPIVYIGALAEVTESAFVLADADLHDCRDGHVGMEEYIAEAHGGDGSVNRSRIVVMRSAVMSISRLADVVVTVDDATPPPCAID